MQASEPELMAHRRGVPDALGASIAAPLSMRTSKHSTLPAADKKDCLIIRRANTARATADE